MISRDDIINGVCSCLRDALDEPDLEINESDRLIGDLELDSLDVLHLVFALEQYFKIKINPRDIERKAKAQLQGDVFEVDGVYTQKGLEELRKALPEVPEEELQPGLTAAELPRHFRVASMVNLVCRIKEHTKV